ncbi:hypothetical protein KFK09_025078 [Dendrobium nobile]|uniref:Uncharacterized protein n=1 Tax=Dendrobium nobile TaxID=94219 RepID=A0A8T3AGP7_DENNO|nr:hypothetical protein KFK09_025078 [Dendrobium nobile]
MGSICEEQSWGAGLVLAQLPRNKMRAKLIITAEVKRLALKIKSMAWHRAVIMEEFPSYCSHYKSFGHSKLECCSPNTIPPKPIAGNESVLPTIVELVNEKVDLDPLMEAVDVGEGHLGSYTDGGSLGLPVPVVTSMVSSETVLISEVVHSPELMVAPNGLVNDGIEVMDLVQEVDDSLASIGKDSLEVIPTVSLVLDVVNIELCCVENMVLDDSLSGMLDVPDEPMIQMTATNTGGININNHRYPLNDAARPVNEIGVSEGDGRNKWNPILYEILCKAAYASLKGSPVITSKEWTNALEAGIAARLDAGVDPVNAFVISADAACSGAESTKNMQAQGKRRHFHGTKSRAGRSSYVSAEMLALVPDPGAMAVASWYRAAAVAVELRLRPSKG